MFGISSSFSDKLQTLVDRTDPVQRLTSTSWQQRQHTGNGVREDSWLFSCNNLMTPPNLGANSFSFAAHKSCQKSCLLGVFMEIFYVERFQYDSFRSSMPILFQTFSKPPWCLSDIFEVELDNYFTNWTFSDILNCPTVSPPVSTCFHSCFHLPGDALWRAHAPGAPGAGDGVRARGHRQVWRAGAFRWWDINGEWLISY